MIEVLFVLLYPLVLYVKCVAGSVALVLAMYCFALADVKDALAEVSER